MLGKRAGKGRQKAVAARDANVAGRNQVIVNVDAAGLREPEVPALLPRDVPGFTGRERELGRLASLAAKGSGAVAAIEGTAGVGKTALAVRAAYRLMPNFPDGSLYADLRGYTEGQSAVEPGEVLEMFLRHLEVPAEGMPAQIEERSGLLRQRLASRRMLLLLDNVRTETQVRQLLPGAGGSLVLITSRSVLAGLEVDERISLDVLSEDEALTLLATVIGPPRAVTEPEAMKQVRDRCGDLPLALRIAGQLLATHPAWPVARLAEMLADERNRLAQLEAGDLQVRAAFVVSYQQLDDGTARMFRLLSLHPGPDFNVPAAASLAGIDSEAAKPVLDRLLLAHLITEDAPGRFGMHDLLRLFARGTCQDTDDQATRDAAEARLVGSYVDLTSYLDACLDPRVRQPVAEAAKQAGGWLPTQRQALVILETERPNLLAAFGLAAERGWDEQVGRLSESLGDAFRRLRYLDDLLTVRKVALDAARRTGDAANNGRALTALGIVYGELRRFEEAISCFQDALTIFRDIGDQSSQGAALSNLGNIYGGLRRFEEAINCFQDALTADRQIGDRHGEGSTLVNLGAVYGEMRRFEEAIDCFQDVLTIFRETGDQYGEGTALGNLGNIDRELRRFDEAMDCFRDAQTIFREIGARHDEGQALLHLGVVYGEMRRFEEAISCFQDALTIFRETGDRYGEGQTAGNLGTVYRRQRRLREAIGCLEDALTIFRDIGERLDEGQALNNLGNIYGQMRRFEKAISCFQDALTIFSETGDRHGQGYALRSLGDTYSKLRQPDSAAKCWLAAAVAMREAGDDEEAGRIEQLATNTRSRPRRWRRSR